MTRPTVLVDAHVHFHEGFALADFLDSAVQNFERAGAALGLAGREPDVLMLTESAGARWFERWWSRPDEAAAGGWSFTRTQEARSLLVHRDGRPLLTLVAGRQLVSAEGLEVLALGVREELGDGRELLAAVEDVRRSGGLPVLPWGVGKWIGRRGRLVESALDRAGRPLFCGDIGGRLRAWPTPALLRRAEAKGVRVLRGADPLPLAGQERRLGAFGFALRAELGLHDPARRLIEVLGGSPEITPYGSGVSLPAFLRAQLGLRLRSLRRKQL